MEGWRLSRTVAIAWVSIQFLRLLVGGRCLLSLWKWVGIFWVIGFFSAIGQELCRPHLTRADTLVFQDGVEGASQQIWTDCGGWCVPMARIFHTSEYVHHFQPKRHFFPTKTTFCNREFVESTWPKYLAYDICPNDSCSTWCARFFAGFKWYTVCLVIFGSIEIPGLSYT